MGIRRILKDTFTLFKESYHDTLGYQLISKTLILFLIIPVFYHLTGYFLYDAWFSSITNNDLALKALTLKWLFGYFIFGLMFVIAFFFEYVWLLFITSSAFNWDRLSPVLAIKKVCFNVWKIFPLALAKALAWFMAAFPFVIIMLSTLYFLPDSMFLPINWLTVTIFLLLILYLVVKFLFVDYSVLIKWKWIRESFFKKYSYSAFLKALGILFLWYFYFGLFFVWVNVIFSVLAYIVLFFTINSQFLFWISTILVVVYFFWNILLTSLFASLNSSLITVLYYELEEKSRAKIEEYKEKNRNKFTFKEVFLILAITIGFTVYSYIDNKPYVENQFKLLNKEIRVSAHRWSSNVAPENTIPAFKQAIEDWVNQIELDIQATKDGEIIVMHDYEPWRLLWRFNWTLISDLNRSDLKDLNVLQWFWGYENIKIPTFREVIKFVKPYKNVTLNVEIKETDKSLNLTQKILQILEEEEFSDRVIFTSLTTGPLQEVKEALPHVKRWFVISAGVGDYYDYDADFYSIATSMVTPELVNKLRENGKWIYFWSFYAKDYMENMIDYRPDEIIANDPSMMRALIKQRDKMNKISKVKKVVLGWTIKWLR